jgi:hypothetical protein
MEHFRKLFDSINLQERSDYLLYLLENDKILQEDFLFQYKKESEEIGSCTEKNTITDNTERN